MGYPYLAFRSCAFLGPQPSSAAHPKALNLQSGADLHFGVSGFCSRSPKVGKPHGLNES